MSTANQFHKNVSEKSPKERRAYAILLQREMDWKNYDCTTWPCADLSFPDLDENTVYDIWPLMPNLETRHVMDLNELKLGIQRFGYLNKFKMPEQVQDLPSVEDAIEKLNVIQELKDTNLDQFNQQIKAYGFSNEKHFSWGIALLDSAEEKAFEAADDLLKEKMQELDAQMDANIAAATEGGLLDPIKGIDMETWAAANVKIAGGTNLEDVLKIIGTEKPIWDEVSAKWNERMAQDTTFAISKVYGDAFTNPNIGKFANNGIESNASNDNGGLSAVMDDFELYIKIMCHQNMGVTQGKDAASILQEYGLTTIDWSSAGAHWTPKMATDTAMALKMAVLMEKYNAEFTSVKAGDDIDF